MKLFVHPPYYLRACMLTLTISLSVDVAALTMSSLLYLSGARTSQTRLKAFAKPAAIFVVLAAVALMLSMLFFFQAVYAAVTLMYPIYNVVPGSESSPTLNYDGKSFAADFCTNLFDATSGRMVEMTSESDPVVGLSTTGAIFTGFAQNLADVFLLTNMLLVILLPALIGGMMVSHLKRKTKTSDSSGTGA